MLFQDSGREVMLESSLWVIDKWGRSFCICICICIFVCICICICIFVNEESVSLGGGHWLDPERLIKL